MAESRRSPWPWILLAAAVLAVAVYLLWPRPRADERLLRWGGDAVGGAPYLIRHGDEEPTGVEGEMMQYLAAKLGRVARFHQNEWDSIPGDLKRGDIDVAFNGFEWTPEREEDMLSTVPYYAYRIRLIVRRDSPITGWDGLKRVPGKPTITVATLRDSASHRYLQEHYADEVKIEALGLDGIIKAMEGAVGLEGRPPSYHAVVQDAPATKWYLELDGDKARYRALHTVGEAIRPVKHPYYCAFVRDPALRAALGDAITEGLRDGSFRAILEKYGLWDADQADLLKVGASWPPPESPRRPTLASFCWQLLLSARTTVLLAALSFPLAVIVGLLVAVGRLYGPALVSYPLAVYVEVMRGTPLVLQLVFIYYFLPHAGVRLDAFTAAVLALALNYAAYEAEIYRAGLLAIPRGQMEAALALGMTPMTALWRIIVPQAVRLVIPPVTNDFIALFKDTAVCSIVAVHELTQQYRTFAVNNPGRMAELALITALLYLMMSYPLSLFARWLELRQERGKVAA